MTYGVSTTTLNRAVAASGTFDMPYPAGLAFGSVSGSGVFFLNDNDIISLTPAFGASSITVTNSSGVTLPAGSRIRGQFGFRPDVLNGQDPYVVNVKDPAFGAVGDGVTDDGPAFQAALTAAGNGGKVVIVPRPSSAYLIDTGNLTVPSGVQIIGEGLPIVRIGPTTLNPLFDLNDGDNITISGLRLEGNLATQTSSSSGSSAINADSGASDILIQFCEIVNWTRHGIALDGVTRARVLNNRIEDTWRGAGVLCSRTAASTDVIVANNFISDTQLANIHAFVAMTNFYVVNNICANTSAGSGSDIVGEIADNITCYNQDSSRVWVQGNICTGSMNHGTHLGGNDITIIGNEFIEPAFDCIALWGAPNGGPTPCARAQIIGNKMRNTTDQNNNKNGVQIREFSHVTVSSNVVENVYDAVRLRGFVGDDFEGVNHVVVTGNTFKTVTRGVYLQQRVRFTNVSANTMKDVASCVVVDNDTGTGFSSPSFYTLIGHNILEDCVSIAIENTGCDFTKVLDNYGLDGSSASAITLVGASSASRTVP